MDPIIFSLHELCAVGSDFSEIDDQLTPVSLHGGIDFSHRRGILLKFANSVNDRVSRGMRQLVSDATR